MVTTRSLEALHYSDLDVVEWRLRGDNDDEILRKVCVELNEFRRRINDTDLHVHARYASLRGVLYAKVGSIYRSITWLGTPRDCLFLALEQFAETDQFIQRCATQVAGRLPEPLMRLQARTAFEAAVVVTQLHHRGCSIGSLPVMPNTGVLSPTQQRVFTNALRGGYPLNSQYR